MSTWAVTGASGFLGTNAGLFLRERAPAVGFSRRANASTPFSTSIELDLRESTQLSAQIRAISPSVIFHGAAIAGHETAANDPKQAYDVNVLATEVLARTASDIGARMIYISTDALFSGKHGDYKETDPVEPFSIYGETKLEGEERVRSTLADHLIVRTNFFGWSETGTKSILEFFVNAMRYQHNVSGYPDFIVTSIYVQHLLSAIYKLNAIGASGTVNVASSNALSKFDFGLTVGEVFGLQSSCIEQVATSSATYAVSRSRDLSLNTHKAASLLGEDLPTQQQGVKQALIDEETIPQAIRSEA